MNPNQLILRNLIKTQTEMLQFSRSNYEDNIFPLLNKMRIDLYNKLETIKLTGITNKQRTQRLNDLFKQTDELIEDYYIKIAKKNRKAVYESAEMTNELFKMRFNRDLGEGLFNVLDLKRLEAVTSKDVFGSQTLKRSSGQWWDMQAKGLQKKYREVVELGIAENEPMYKIIQKIRGSRVAKYSDGIMKISYIQAKILARSSIIQVSNATRMKIYQENSDILSGIKWISTLDSRTTFICAMLDGAVWDLNFKPVGHDSDYPGETAHFGCRSTQIPVLLPYADMPKSKQKIIDSMGTRSSYKGYVPKDLSYEKFLAGESAEFQNKVLGKTRAEWFREGKLDISDMLSKDFEKITIEELYQKFPKLTA